MIGNNKVNIIRRFFKVTIVILFILFVTSIPTYYYVNYSYNKLINNFYNEFNNSNFSTAENLLSDNNLILKLKKQTLKKDLNTYFTTLVDNLCSEIKNGKTMASTAVTVFKEIRNYNIVDNSIDKLILSIDKEYVPTNTKSNKSILDLAISEYNSGRYSEAIQLLKNIHSSDTDFYAKAKGYINKCKDGYKTQLFKEADKLIANKYYTKALDLLSDIDTSILSNDDSDLQKKINSIETVKAEYLSSGYLNDSEYTSTAIMDAITIDNINSFNIESKTEYFLYVNLAEQKTYIYRGSKNDWNLYKSFLCSTGIAGEETPKGIYAVSDRGDWFYSDDYDQGGKYWVRFMGEYLFHSLPFNEDASKVVDDTLGKPASHGCIRLNIEDAKWIYDNIDDNTKVIIN